MNIKICFDVKYIYFNFNKNIFIKMLIIFNYLGNLFLIYFPLVKYKIIMLKRVTTDNLSYFFLSENTFYTVKKIHSSMSFIRIFRLSLNNSIKQIIVNNTKA